MKSVYTLLLLAIIMLLVGCETLHNSFHSVYDICKVDICVELVAPPVDESQPPKSAEELELALW